MNKKTIFATIVLALVAFIGFGLYKSSDLKSIQIVSKVTIKGSKPEIFDMVKYLNNFPKWSPFLVQDPSQKYEVKGVDGAVGAPEGHRTTSMVDRAMRPFEKFLTNRMYFHGHFATAEHTCTAFAICHNFAPFAPRTRQFNKEHANCRADELNGFAYRENWL